MPPISASESQRVPDLPDGEIEIRTGSATGPVIGRIAIPETDGWQNWRTIETPLTAVTGIQDLYIGYTEAGSNESGTGAMFNFNWFELVIQTEGATNLTEAPISGTSVTLNWDAVPDAVGYVIGRSVSQGGSYTTVGNTTGTTFTDTGLTAGTKYYYVITTQYGSFEDGESIEIVAVPSNPISPESMEFGPSGVTDDSGSGDAFHFSLNNSEPGHMYQAQASGSLEVNDWTDMGEERAGNGGFLEFVMPISEADSKHFYRLKIRQE